MWLFNAYDSYWAVRSCSTLYYAGQDLSNFEVCGVTIQLKYAEILLIMLHKVVLISHLWKKPLVLLGA